MEANGKLIIIAWRLVDPSSDKALEDMINAELNNLRRARDEAINHSELANTKWNEWRSEAITALNRAILAERELAICRHELQEWQKTQKH